MRKIYLMFGLVLGVSSMTMAQGEDCANAVPVTFGSHAADGPSTGTGAVNTDGGTSADWYSFTATCDGTVDIHSCASGLDTDLFLYQDNCPTSTLELINNDDDGCSLGCCASGIYGQPVVAGTTYYIEWGNQWSNAPFNWDLVSNIPAPNNIVTSGLTSGSIAIDWDPAGAETSWNVEYGVSGFAPGSGTVLNVTGTSDTAITGLMAETTYEFYIIALPGPCGGTAGPISFTTLPVCPVPTGLTTTPGSINTMFDWTPGGIEVEWDVEYGPTGMLLGSGTQAYGIILGSDTTVTGLMATTDYDWYVRAVCDFVAPIDTFSLWVGPIAFTTDPLCQVPLDLDTAGGNEFTAGLTWVPGGLESMWNYEWGDEGFTPGSGTTVSTTSPAGPNNIVTGLIPGQTYDYYVQADCGGGLGTSAWTGPFSWTQPEFCLEPSTGTFANLTTTSVDFSWIAGGTETDWTIEYGINGFTLGTGTQMQTTNTTEAISGLNVDTEYCFYVQANCGSTPDSASAFVGPFCVTTLPTCFLPSNLSAINITTTAANLIWQAGGSETSWTIEWGAPGFTPGTGTSDGGVSPTSSNPYYATGLTPGGAYDYYVQAICGAGDSSQWAGPFTFVTNCAAVISAPYTQNFDGSLTTPSCWTNPNIGEPWIFYSSTGTGFPNPNYGVQNSLDHTSGSGNFAWIDASGSGIDPNELVSPMIDISGLTVPSAGFWLLSNNIDDGAQNTIRMDVWDGFNWIMMGTYGGNDPNWIELEFNVPAGVPDTTQFRLVQLQSTTGVGSAFFNDLLVDDFWVDEGVPCTTVSAGTAVAGPFCTDGTTDVFAAVTGATDDNGTFWFPSAAAGNQNFSATSGSLILTGLDEGVDYTFDYVVNNACGNADTLSIVYNWSMAPNAGGDGSLSTCVNHEVVLIQELAGSFDFGGTWSDDDNAGGMVNGIFNPVLTTPGTYAFTYTVDNGTCSDDATVMVTVEACASVEENAIVMSVYPNPVVDNLTVNLTNVDANAIVELFTLQGQAVIAPTAINNSTINVNMSTVADGVYILKVTANGSTEEVRVVKK